LEVWLKEAMMRFGWGSRQLERLLEPLPLDGVIDVLIQRHS
jgi:hypothetical protein